MPRNPYAPTFTNPWTNPAPSNPQPRNRPTVQPRNEPRSRGRSSGGNRPSAPILQPTAPPAPQEDFNTALDRIHQEALELQRQINERANQPQQPQEKQVMQPDQQRDAPSNPYAPSLEDALQTPEVQPVDYDELAQLFQETPPTIENQQMTEKLKENNELLNINIRDENIPTTVKSGDIESLVPSNKEKVDIFNETVTQVSDGIGKVITQASPNIYENEDLTKTRDQLFDNLRRLNELKDAKGNLREDILKAGEGHLSRGILEALVANRAGTLNREINQVMSEIDLNERIYKFQMGTITQEHDYQQQMIEQSKPQYRGLQEIGGTVQGAYELPSGEVVLQDVRGQADIPQQQLPSGYTGGGAPQEEEEFVPKIKGGTYTKKTKKNDDPTRYVQYETSPGVFEELPVADAHRILAERKIEEKALKNIDYSGDASVVRTNLRSQLASVISTRSGKQSLEDIIDQLVPVAEKYGVTGLDVKTLGSLWRSDSEAKGQANRLEALFKRLLIEYNDQTKSESQRNEAKVYLDQIVSTFKLF